MGADRIGEFGDRSSEGQTAGMYGTGFTLESLLRVGARDRTRRPEMKVGSDKELMEVRRMQGMIEGGCWTISAD